MVEVEWMDGDMSKGLTVTHQDPFTSTLDLRWEDVDSAISQLLAYRELMGTKKRLGLSIFKEGGGGGGGNEGNEDGVDNYGGTK